jgi:hypothetical protein
MSPDPSGHCVACPVNLLKKISDLYLHIAARWRPTSFAEGDRVPLPVLRRGMIAKAPKVPPRCSTRSVSITAHVLLGVSPCGRPAECHSESIVLMVRQAGWREALRVLKDLGVSRAPAWRFLLRDAAALVLHLSAIEPHCGIVAQCERKSIRPCGCRLTLALIAKLQ